MGFLDKFLDAMKLDDDDDYYDDDFFDEDEEEEEFEEKPKKKLFGKKKKDEDDDYLDEPAPVIKEKPRVVKTTNTKVTPIRQSNKRTGGNGMEVCVIKPTSFNDGSEIVETLLDGRAVVLNLEGVDVDIAQRLIDFASGACFSISGNLQNVSHYIFLITPPNVNISGNFQNILSNAYDVSPLKTSF